MAWMGIIFHHFRCGSLGIRMRCQSMYELYKGSCHCGAIKFEVTAPQHLDLVRCNCSICHKSGFLHLIVPKSRFKLLQGQASLTTYRFGSMVAAHTFCKVCGVKPFYTPRSNPDGVDVNFYCLDSTPTYTISDFDGQNWEKYAHTLAHKSRE